MKDQFRELASYNAWANLRLYEAALALPEELYRTNVGVFFQSLHGTLNHLLLTDQWFQPNGRQHLLCGGERQPQLESNPT